MHSSTHKYLQPSTVKKVVSIGVAAAVSLAIFAATAHIAGFAHAQAAPTEPMVYPARGQTPPEQSRDRYECYEWAKRQTGFDPTQSSAYASAIPSQSSAYPARGTTGAMVGGAASGAAIAELSHHDPARGAAIGVLGGGLMAQAKQQQAMQAKQQQAAQQQAAQGQRRATYDRAFGACMDARGYAVR
jgi:hypothetical protein